MSFAWMAAHGDVPADPSHAAPAWACTGCFACRESCDHRNDVTGVLLDARDAQAKRGVAPEGAKRAIARFPDHDERTRAAAREHTSNPVIRPDAAEAVLVGCGYLLRAQKEARDAIAAAAGVAGRPLALVGACCGLPLRLAGDAAAFTRHAREFAKAVSAYARLLVVDAGCGLALKRRYPDAGVELAPQVELLVEAAARAAPSAFQVVPLARQGAVRWHDPCQLGRGLGVYEAPREVLARALGRPPDELVERRERAVCSGAGGLLPSTMPAVASGIADARLEAHDRAGGGRIVTACASSLIALRKRAGASGAPVDDLSTWIAGSLQGRPLG
jgi:Fe-S oxidoreductase